MQCVWQSEAWSTTVKRRMLSPVIRCLATEIPAELFVMPRMSRIPEGERRIGPIVTLDIVSLIAIAGDEGNRIPSSTDSNRVHSYRASLQPDRLPFRTDWFDNYGRPADP